MTPARIAPRKLSFRVNGTRGGSPARPTDSASTPVAVSPPKRFGMIAPRTEAVAKIDPGDYATAADYE